MVIIGVYKRLRDPDSAVCINLMTVTIIVKGEKKFIRFREWGDLIQKSFEKYFYIPKGKIAMTNDYLI